MPERHNPQQKRYLLQPVLRQQLPRELAMKVVDAGMAKVPRLYHYQRYVPKRDDPKRDDPKRLEQIVAGQVIYLSNPNDFNDPWDCRPDNHLFSSALQVQYCETLSGAEFCRRR
jgi:hypothetical protein